MSATSLDLSQIEGLPTSEPDEYRLYTFQSWQVNWVWDRVEPILARVPLEPGMSLEQVRKDLCTADAQLWTVWLGPEIEAAWTTRVQKDPDGSLYCLAWMCAGQNVSHWIHLTSHMEDWAREMGCKDIRVVGRPGWKKYGYRPLYTVLSKHLGGDNAKSGY